ncbi:MAG TPA: three-Cys-motif partner protein TcmP [Desulfomonilaceae bacterium]|nr:three-Cys-motif partner protein TcmP [Desulfomonilaceae bacterium]
MVDGSFFQEITEQSRLKTSIVTKYFSTWANIMIKAREKIGKKRIGYFDLFCGPGIYEDGTKSSPLLVLEKAVADPDLREHLVTTFMDENQESVNRLSQEVTKIENIRLLKHSPVIEVGTTDEDLAQHFAKLKMIPTLLFLDPWGYKGLSLSLIHSVLKDWGSECIFFFNYRRVNAALDNPKFEKLVHAIFGEQRAIALQRAIKPLNPEEREFAIMKALDEALTKEFPNFVLTFKFRNEPGTRTSHYLVFVTKDRKGYDIMKDIMAKLSLRKGQSIPSFQFGGPQGPEQTNLFESGESLEQLRTMLLEKLAGQTRSMQDIFEQTSVGTKYIKKNYKEVLLQLEHEGRVVTEPPKHERRSGTLADHVKITFPPA